MTVPRSASRRTPEPVEAARHAGVPLAWLLDRTRRSTRSPVHAGDERPVLLSSDVPEIAESYAERKATLAAMRERTGAPARARPPPPINPPPINPPQPDATRRRPPHPRRRSRRARRLRSHPQRPVQEPNRASGRMVEIEGLPVRELQRKGSSSSLTQLNAICSSPATARRPKRSGWSGSRRATPSPALPTSSPTSSTASCRWRTRARSPG